MSSINSRAPPPPSPTPASSPLSLFPVNTFIPYRRRQLSLFLSPLSQSFSPFSLSNVFISLLHSLSVLFLCSGLGQSQKCKCNLGLQVSVEGQADICHREYRLSGACKLKGRSPAALHETAARDTSLISLSLPRRFSLVIGISDQQANSIAFQIFFKQLSWEQSRTRKRREG